MHASRRLRVFAGPNGSGKSTILATLKEEWIGVYVNADEIEKTLRRQAVLDLAEFGIAPARAASLRQHLQESTLLQKAGLADEAERIRIEGQRIRFDGVEANSYFAASLADFIRRELVEQGISFTFETVMSYHDKVDFMGEAQRRGYRTYLYFVATDDPLINIGRVQQRVSEGGHPVEESKIVERYWRSIELLGRAAEVANRAYVFDNSGDEHVLIAEITDGSELKVHADELPRWFTQSGLWMGFASAWAESPGQS